MKYSALITGGAFGWSVGLLEIATLILVLPKLIIATLDAKGRDNEFVYQAQFFNWVLDQDKSASQYRGANLLIANTMIATLASWAGRLLGLVLSACAITLASAVVLPIYAVVKSFSDYSQKLKQEKKAEIPALNKDNPSNSSLTVLANKTLKNKGLDSTKDYSKKFGLTLNQTS